MDNRSVIRALAIVFLCCALACGTEPDKDVEGFLKPIPKVYRKGPSPFEGTWTVIRVERDGAPIAVAELGIREEITFEGDVLVGLQSEDKADESFVTIAVDSKPMRVARWLKRQKDGTYDLLWTLGIAEVRDGKLYWCEGRVRHPAKEFKTGPSDEKVLIVAERAK